MNKQVLLIILLVAIIVSMAIAWGVTSSSTAPLRKLGLSERQLGKFSSELGKCSTVAELRAGKVITGRMSFCMVAYRPHYFLIVEEGTYDGKGNFTRTGEQFAFSYVPESVILADRYRPDEREFREGAIEPSSLDGYNPFTTSPSHIFDSWKFTNDFLRLYSVKIMNWTFKDYLTLFSRYNVLTLVPIRGITDCIGYSCYHIYHRADDTAGRLKDESFKQYLQDFIDMGFVKSFGQ
jgi:hypothetical protein